MSASLTFRRQPFVTQKWLLGSLLLGMAAWEGGARCAAASDETAAQAFAAAQAAAMAVSEKLVSAIGTGEFSVFVQQKEDDQPKLSSKAQVHVYFDRGKYHVQLTYEKRVQRFSTTENGKRTFSTEEGQGDEARIIADDEAVYVVNFSKRFGTAGQIFAREQEQAGFAMSGFGLNEPARLWKKLPDLDQVIMKVGADTISYSEIGDGRFRATYPYFATPYTAEVDVDRAAGFHVTAFRVFNPERKNAAPLTDVKATWRKLNDTWHVNEFLQEHDTRGSGAKSEVFSRSVFKYNLFEVNVKVEPDLFELKSFVIPIGTQFTDRRKKNTLQLLYWNGKALQTERP